MPTASGTLYHVPAGEQSPAAAGQTEDLYRLLSRPWRDAKLGLFKSHLSLSEDVALAIDVVGQSPVHWDYLIGGCLISASLRTLADEVSLGEIGASAESGKPDRLAQAGDKAALSLLVEAFKSAGAAGRPCFLAVLEQSAAILAAMDGGKTLGRVYDELIAVEAWWCG